MTMIKLTWRASQTALALLALAALVAACGSSSGSSSTTTSAATGSASSNQRTKLAACLKQHGITLPAGGRFRRGGRPGGGFGGGGASGTGTGTTGTGTTPGGSPPTGGFRRGGGGFLGGGFAGNSKFRAALRACGANFPAGRRPGGFNRQAIQKFVTCVRQHGYNLPAPNFSGKGGVFPANIRTNKKFQSASKACQSLLVPRGGAGGSGAGGGGSGSTGA
jgi:hypothetical protein